MKHHGIYLTWFENEFVMTALCPFQSCPASCKVGQFYLDPPEQADQCIYYQGGDCIHPATRRAALNELAKRINEEIAVFGDGRRAQEGGQG